MTQICSNSLHFIAVESYTIYELYIQSYILYCSFRTDSNRPSLEFDNENISDKGFVALFRVIMERGGGVKKEKSTKSSIKEIY